MAPRRGRAAAAATATKQPLDEEQPVVSTTDGDSGKAEAPKKPASAVSRKGKKPQPATENGSNEPENAPAEPVNGNAAGSRKRKAKANDVPPADAAKPSRTRDKGKADKNGADAQSNVEAEPPATTKRTAKSKATKHQETSVEAEVDEQPAKPKRGRKDQIKNVPDKPAPSKAKGKTPASEEQPATPKRGKKAGVADDAEQAAEEAAPSKAPAKKAASKKRKGATETTVEPASEQPAQDEPAGNGRSAASRRKPAEKPAPANEPEKATPKPRAPAKTKQSAKAKEPPKAAAKAKKAKKDEKQETQPENNDVDEIDGGILAKKSSKPKKKAKKAAAGSDEEEHVPLPKKRKPVDEEPAPETVDEPKAEAGEQTPSTITKRKKPAAKPAERSEQQKMNAVQSDFSQIDFESDKEHTLKICSWNVAGLRAMVNKSGHEYFEHEKPDIICLQEIKCLEDQVPEHARLKDYHPYWCSTPGGRGGVALLTRKMPYNVEVNLGDAEMDEEGRIITADYTKFYLVCVYVPNAGRNLANLDRRLRWNKLFEAHVNKLKQTKPVIICGDLNVAHNEIGEFGF